MKTLLPLIGIAWIIISCNTENDLDYYTTMTEMGQTIPKNNIDLIDASLLSDLSKTSFQTFLHTLVEGTYGTLLDRNDYIRTYEDEVRQRHNWPERDRILILAATSFLRQTGFTLYSNGEEEDEDWDIAVGNIQ